MRIVAIAARILLGLIFGIFGMNHYLNFIPMGKMPSGVAGQFLGALMASHYMYVVAFFEVVPAILLLIGVYVPLALVLLAPVIFNICLTNFLMTPQGIPISIAAVILWLLVAWRVRSAFAGILQPRVSA